MAQIRELGKINLYEASHFFFVFPKSRNKILRKFILTIISSLKSLIRMKIAYLPHCLYTRVKKRRNLLSYNIMYLLINK